MIVEGIITQIIMHENIGEYSISIGDYPECKDLVVVQSEILYRMGLFRKVFNAIFFRKWTRNQVHTIFLDDGIVEKRKYIVGSNARFVVSNWYKPTQYYIEDYTLKVR